MAKLLGPDQFDESEVADGGSDYGYWRVVDSTVQATLGADEWAEMPIREKYDAVNNDSPNKKTSEGQTERTVNTKRSRTLTVDFQQFDSEGEIYIDIPAAMEGNIVEILLERNQEIVNGKKSYFHAFLSLTKPPSPGAGKAPQFEFDIRKATDAITVAVNVTAFPNFTGIGTGGNLVQAAGSFFGIAAFSAS